VTLADTSHHMVYLSDDSGSPGQRLAYILKRLLLSHSNSEGATVQIAVVQSIVLLLKGPQASSFAVTILKADTAGHSCLDDICVLPTSSALTLLVGWQEGHLACKKWGDGGGGH